jgi:L-threonylcarbamoyladenylate synthase
MPLTLKIDPENPDGRAMAEAIGILKSGGVIAFPTETFYGIGADAGNEKAVERIFLIKGRDFKNPIPVIIGNMTDIEKLVSTMPETGRRLMEKYWPGPLTLVFRASAEVSLKITAGTGKIGIRLSSNILATEFARGLSGALTATSANLSGQRESSSAHEVVENLGESVDAVVDGGRTPGGQGSTIVDVTVDPAVVLREGVIPSGKIFGSLGKVL